ncbi:S1C family serine protease [Acetobacterium woodii]|uniref:Serine protease n=1 Tax=Acetobacterium woodii (strain ATCC 29683 / DSM 1030 / JCM 2381 / KCTC 1655 / WB1) TaxID=931626 RepID=H6LKH5_ACEWD|nr:trypsin-like peptidase domain-containing protein [Acetobacterium woodii]AFA47565.1 serine protease [Acetobacterium woodii DSM 1030]
MNEDFKQEKKPNSFIIGIIGAIIGGLIVGVLFLGANYFLNDSSVIQGAKQEIVVNGGSADTVVEAIAQTVPPSVVGIETTGVAMTNMGPQQQKAVGSGFILTSDGYIATNQHVASDGVTSMNVSLADGSAYDGKLVWSDSSLDLAIIKIDAKDLPVLELGDSDNVVVGELAVAVGNPMGLNFERTVTAGIVSALNRSIPLENGLAEDLIQTDASINSGNSGGPLIDKAGKVIGINTYKLTTGEGMGFAIPINILKPILNEIVATGGFKATVMGITGYDRAIADYYLADSDVKFTNGIYIASVQQGGGAANAGLQAGDIITEINGVTTNTMIKMKEILYAVNPGDTVTVTFERNGQSQTKDVTVSAGQ